MHIHVDYEVRTSRKTGGLTVKRFYFPPLHMALCSSKLVVITLTSRSEFGAFRDLQEKYELYHHILHTIYTQ